MCFFGFKSRHRAQSVSETLDKEKTTDGVKRFRRVEMLFQPVSLAADFTTLLLHEV